MKSKGPTEKVNLSVNQLKKIYDWAVKNSADEVDITVSRSSGIGPSVRVEIRVLKDQGIWLDVTETENW